MAGQRIELHSGAREDYLESLDWYRDRSILVARRFQDELRQAFDQIAANPEIYAADRNAIRWKRMDHFPHVIYFRIRDSQVIEVLAIAHGRRRTGYWQDRIP
jgi:plasmid stabilization system protein ParE